MELKTYQELALQTAIYPKDKGLEYTTLGLVGEAGEIANKVKKVIRDSNGVLTEEKKADLGKEIGDVLWYCAALSQELGQSLDEIATNNIQKLQKRMEENKIKGSGDNR